MSHRVPLTLALVVLASLGATRVHAQEPIAEDTPADEPSREGAIEEESLEDLLGLELEDTMGTTSAVSRTEENVLSAPASVTTLDARAIRLSGARTIPELLRLVTGVQVQRVAPGSYLVAMRGAGGITGNNVIIMLDGMPLNSPVDGAIDWSTVPIHPRDLERIDVVRGPVSTIYGANAYTGVIQLVSYRGFGTVPQGAVRAEVGIDTAGHPVTDLAGVYSRAGERFQRAVFAHASYDSVFSDSQSGTLEPRISGALLARLGATLAAGQLDFEVSGSIAHGSSLEHFVLEDIREQRLLGMAQLRFTSRDLPGALGTIGAFARTQLRAIQTDRLDYSGFSYDGTRSARTSVGSEFTLVPHPTPDRHLRRPVRPRPGDRAVHPPRRERRLPHRLGLLWSLRVGPHRPLVVHRRAARGHPHHDRRPGLLVPRVARLSHGRPRHSLGGGQRLSRADLRGGGRPLRGPDQRLDPARRAPPAPKPGQRRR
ncbi:MAG: TonB-dependent receptor plug domain-containing protein [Sandaracinaceae bacterium]|nr:TonB-dependent receptor plug domain-containing protein [Sandaracinaceae bacterium]